MSKHNVEEQWHYSIAIAAGFIPVTKDAEGMVRSYQYRHPDGRELLCCTGVHADYWRMSDGGYGYWRTLETYLSK